MKIISLTVIKLIRSTSKLDYGVVNDILEKCLSIVPPNLLLFQNISEDILKTVDLKVIVPDIITKFMDNLQKLGLNNCFEMLIEKCKIEIPPIYH